MIAQKPTIRLMLAGVLAVSLAACSPAPSGSDATLDQTAVIEQRLPTLNAQLTAYATQIEGSAPTVQANMTLLATLGPVNPADVTNISTETSLTPGPTISEGGSSDSTAQPTSDASFNDVNQTTQTQAITLGQSVSGTLATATEAHNWTFQGTAGQSLTIRVTGSGGSDPRVKVFDPAGNEIGSDDDGGGSGNALLTVTLTTAGSYIIRVDTWRGGDYTLSVE